MSSRLNTVPGVLYRVVHYGSTVVLVPLVVLLTTCTNGDDLLTK